MPFVQYSMQLPISSSLSINLRQWHALDILSSNNPVLNHPEIFPILSVKKNRHGKSVCLPFSISLLEQDPVSDILKILFYVCAFFTHDRDSFIGRNMDIIIVLYDPGDLPLEHVSYDAKAWYHAGSHKICPNFIDHDIRIRDAMIREISLCYISISKRRHFRFCHQYGFLSRSQCHIKQIVDSRRAVDNDIIKVTLQLVA